MSTSVTAGSKRDWARDGTASRPFETAPFGRGLVAAGWLVLALFLGGLGIWSFIAPVEGAVVASGVVSVDSSRKRIAHLEGGTIAAIHVSEGQTVTTGEPLIDLDVTAAVAERNRVRALRDQSLAALARLRAERVGADKVSFPESLTVRAADREISALLDGERRIFASRRQLAEDRVAVLGKQIGAMRDEFAGLQRQRDAARKRLSLIDEELRVLERLFKKRMVEKTRLLALRRERSQVEGALGEYVASMARTRQQQEGARLRIVELKSEALRQSVESLRERQAEVFAYARELETAEHVLKRAHVVSPTDGVVVGLRVHTIGGVVAAGETLLEIVPSDDDLIVEASINPADIENVYPGQPAHVELTALERRWRTPVEGIVLSISADRLKDPTTGTPYFLGRIALSPRSAQAAGINMQPGMSAEVMIRTSARSPFDYLIAPVSRSLSRALREQ